MYVTSVGKSSVNISILDDMREHMPESNHVNVDYVGNSSVNILPLDDEGTQHWKGNQGCLHKYSDLR